MEYIQQFGVNQLCVIVPWVHYPKQNLTATYKYVCGYLVPYHSYKLRQQFVVNECCAIVSWMYSYSQQKPNQANIVVY